MSLQFVSPHMTKTHHYNQHTISYSIAGKGNPIVLLHGFLENKSMWDAYAEKLQKNYSVVAIDIPGHGESDTVAEVQSMELLADIVSEMLSQEKITDAFVVGHSMGGYIALQLAKNHGSHVRGICLFNSTTLADTEEKKKDRLRAVKVFEKSPKVFINEAIPNLFAPENLSRFKEEIITIKADALACRVDGITACLRGMKDRPNMLPFLQQTELPVLFIVGKHDPIIPFKRMKEQLTAPNNVQSLVLEDAGHMCFLEEEKACYNQLEAFAAKVFTNTPISSE